MRFIRNPRVAALTAAVGLLCLAVPTVVRAQTTSASVFGEVKDAQAAAMPGATVTFTSRMQANSLTATTDSEGHFVFAIVRPDHYTLKVTDAGLQDCRAHQRGRHRERQALRGRHLARGRRRRGERQRHEPRQRSFTLESESIKDVAANGRMMFNFALLVPGALSEDANAGEERTSVSSFTGAGLFISGRVSAVS